MPPCPQIGRRSREASRTHYLLTIIQDYWRTISCPKLPQRRPRRVGSDQDFGTGREHTLMSFDFMSGINALGGGVLGYLIPFLFVLTLVVFFHELGHFLVARWCGVRVLVFSIGFGPELFGLNDRHGTRWKLSAIPLGGYVKFFGDDNAASVPDAAALAPMTDEERRHSFVHQSVAPRAPGVVPGAG